MSDHGEPKNAGLCYSVCLEVF